MLVRIGTAARARSDTFDCQKRLGAAARFGQREDPTGMVDRRVRLRGSGGCQPKQLLVTHGAGQLSRRRHWARHLPHPLPTANDLSSGTRWRIPFAANPQAAPTRLRDRSGIAIAAQRIDARLRTRVLRHDNEPIREVGAIQVKVLRAMGVHNIPMDHAVSANRRNGHDGRIDQVDFRHRGAAVVGAERAREFGHAVERESLV